MTRSCEIKGGEIEVLIGGGSIEGKGEMERRNWEGKIKIKEEIQ